MHLFTILYNEPTNAQLIYKLLYCCYIFRHYGVILRQPAVSTLLSVSMQLSPLRVSAADCRMQGLYESKFSQVQHSIT
jgi:hypothetical protein